MKSKRQKYNNQRIGKYRSKLEKEIWETRPKVRGIKYGYEEDSIPYSIERKYIPDFTLTLPSGKKIFIEVKGAFNREQKTKMAFVKHCNPDLDIRIVFGSRRTSNENWCKKYGYPFAVGGIPKEWLDESCKS